jgi:hypothetical protein
MTDTDFPSTIAFLHSKRAGPSLEQIKVLERQAILEGRVEDASEYGRMSKILSRPWARRAHMPLIRRAVAAALLSAGLVVAIHYLV